MYRFFLTANGTGPLVSYNSLGQYTVDLRILHRGFEKAIKSYEAKLSKDTELQKRFTKMFGKYGRIYIG